MPKTVKSER